MFRLKKPADNGTEPIVKSVAPEEPPQFDAAADADAEAIAAPVREARPVPRRPSPPAVRPAPPAAALEARRPGEPAGATARSDAPSPQVRERTLLVGRDVEFAGEIKACQRLVVDGTVNVSAAACRHLLVSPSGVYRGQIEVAEAEILGRFEGTLIARERLIVRGSGRVSGKIRYGAIIVEAGGEISGEIKAIARSGETVERGEATEASSDRPGGERRGVERTSAAAAS